MDGLIIFSYAEKASDIAAKTKGLNGKHFHALSGKKPHKLSQITGKHPSVKESIRRLPLADKYFAGIAKQVVNEKLQYVAFYCKHGHHRSVACAAILQEDYFKHAKVKDLNL